MRVLAIPGSVRVSSTNRALLGALAALAPDGVHVALYEGLAQLPMFSPELADAALPPAVAELSERIAAADALVICTPEYAFGMPGVLKNALDWLVSTGNLYDKPVAALSASPNEGGAARALAWLRETLSAHNAHVPARATFAVPFVRHVLSAPGGLDASTAERLRGVFESLKVAVAERGGG